MTSVKFDVTGVKPRLPFPMHDPHVDGMRPGNGRPLREPVELPPEQEKFRLFTVGELSQFPPVEWLIDKYLAAGELSVLYGQGGTYKSFLALDWACLLATQGFTVVYIVAEGASGMRARIAAWQKAHNVSELPSLWLMPSNVNLHGEKSVTSWIEAMRTQLHDETPDLVVVDTLARNFVGGSENNPQEMGMFVEGCERIRTALGTAVMVLHHTTKDGKTERGTESLRNASFAMFKMTKTGKRSVRLECERMKEAEPPECVPLLPDVVALPELAEPGEDVSSLVTGWSSSPPKRPEARGKLGGELLDSQRKGLKRLLEASGEASGGASRAAVAKAFGITSKNVSRTVKTLVDAGFLEHTGSTSNRRYIVTDAGREAL